MEGATVLYMAILSEITLTITGVRFVSQVVFSIKQLSEVAPRCNISLDIITAVCKVVNVVSGQRVVKDVHLTNIADKTFLRVKPTTQFVLLFANDQYAITTDNFALLERLSRASNFHAIFERVPRPSCALPRDCHVMPLTVVYVQARVDCKVVYE